ncbi:MAG: DUF2135 domain-containing protein, partial [Kiritimatiellae bacterium]|nr:DUF2135 domain-containing protein [Kiritimatiellia bacterium]
LPTPPLRPEPPSLTISAPGNAPAELRSLDLRATVRGLYATVETTLVFHNPNDRVLEGELVFPLPDGAAVCGYALDIDGALVPGVVVPKEKARVAFETEVRRGVDPGLVEHVRGNVYRTRVYPLPANADRTIRLSYVTPLPADADGAPALFLPMPRTPLASRAVSIDVVNDNPAPPSLSGLGDARFARAESRWHVESSETGVAPADDLLVALPPLPDSFAADVETTPDGRAFFAISLPPPRGHDKTILLDHSHIVVLWDASASRAAADHDREYALLAAIPDSPAFTLHVLRDTHEPPVDFPSADALVAHLKKLDYDGGTDLSWTPKHRANRLALLFTDGIDTLSGAAPRKLRGIVPVVSQTDADRESLRQACGGRLIDLQIQTPEDAAHAALFAPDVLNALDGDGVSAVQGIGRDFQGRIRILGELTADEATVTPVVGDHSLAPVTLTRASARPGTVLATAWAAARAESLAPRADDHADELLALGRSYGIVSPATSLLVLDTLDQWVRHEIEPPAALPELRAAWQSAMDKKRESDASAVSSHIDALGNAWRRHVEWWTDPAPFSPAQGNNHRPVYRQDPDTGFVEATDGAPHRPGLIRRLFAGSANARSASAPADGMAAPADDMVAYEADDSLQAMIAEHPEILSLTNGGPAEDSDSFGGPAPADASAGSAPVARVTIKPWTPDVPYLAALRRARTPATRLKAYLKARADWSASPAFYLDCADHLYAVGDAPLARRVLSNLAELRIDDPALLRVFAWRLRQAGELDLAVVQLRRVARLRPEDPQSFRDLALVLAERGQANHSRADIEEAFSLFRKVALTPWKRHPVDIALFALEEHNALAAWVDAQPWPDGAKPAPAEPLPEPFRTNLDLDIRIVMSWDADSTDMDLHVVEPSGEECFWQHRNTLSGGWLSPDITDGYGPEEYLLRNAPAGEYAIKAKYYASHQQSIVGPATLTVDVFTHWARPAQTRQTLTLRLDKAKDITPIGSVTFTPPPAPEKTAP